MLGDKIHDLALLLEQNKQVVGKTLSCKNFGYGDKIQVLRKMAITFEIQQPKV